ncbi:MAG: sugar phosphate isomerase/epimerase [Alicyclobacillus sp.]|nr:sugar phosphate isomerase/epimerase [Alicyclobacillus sp.]
MGAAAAAGFLGYELRAPKVDEYLVGHSVRDLRELLQSHGVTPLSINAIERFNTVDEKRFEEVVKLVRKQAEIADAIDCPYLVFVPEPGDRPWPDVQALTATRLEQVASQLSSYRVRPLLEFIGFPQFSIQTLEQAVSVCEAVHGAEIGIVLDTFHHVIGGGGPKMPSEWVERIKLVHLDDVEPVTSGALSDENRVLPGEGIGQLAELVSSLRYAGYCGAYSVELFRPAYWDMDPKAVATRAYASAARVVRGGQ